MSIQPHELPSYTDFDSVIELFELQALRFKDNVLLHYQLVNSMEFRALTYGQVNEITTYLANSWKSMLHDKTQCIATLSDDPAQCMLAFFTALKLNVSYFPVSTHCSEAAISHLLKETNTGFLIATPTNGAKARKCAAAVYDLKIGVKIWDGFDVDQLVATATAVSTPPADEYDYSREKRRRVMSRDPTATVTWLHSSGTTSAFPKPIPHSTRSYMYVVIEIILSSIQNNSPDLAMDSTDVMLITEKMFHAPAVYLFGATVLISSAIELEQLAEYLQQTSFDYRVTLERFKFTLCHGAPLRQPIGNLMRSQGLNIQNAYGMTEVGCLSLSDVSRSNDKNWHSIKPTSASMRYMSFEPFNNDMYQLVVHSNCPSLPSVAANLPNGDFTTKDLFIEDQPGSGTWTFVGRTDDLLLMSTGEKVNPLPLEKEICKEAIIRKCIVVGENRPSTAVLVELKVSEALSYSPVKIISTVYEAVHRANKHAPFHGTVAVPDMVYILPLNKQLPTTPKGSVSRKKVITDFEQEIQLILYDSNFLSDIVCAGGHKRLVSCVRNALTEQSSVARPERSHTPTFL
ncbi:hypothetical protein BDB00DRAFT_893523 [Zychaea mexicana]|uniref:uncharacterized protein n=1 Tax=Zychaea mexicana TaxID=64656 RepID=UPI0022FEBBCB|nr:uncharacterized protein BDB00DRAFT_893523 [Zychaea mexicana]KAI9496239.1 hypothetical protein BDB00DRAFT_893523 [Zychaea mexicana]